MYLDAFDDDREACMRRAEEAGVAMTALPNIDATTIPALNAMMEAYPGKVIGMMGLHPSSVGAGYEADLEVIGEALESGGYHAVGA